MGRYSPRQMVLAANAFLALGPKDCRSSIVDLCVWNTRRDDPSFEWFDNNDRLLLLIRVLFVSDPVDPISIPPVGRPSFPIFEGDASDILSEWPYFPIEFSKGIPLLLPREFELSGAPIVAGTYFNICESKGWLRRSSFHVPTNDDLVRAVELLVASRRWRASRWEIYEIGDSAKSTISQEVIAREYIYSQCGLIPPPRKANHTAEPSQQSRAGSP